MSLMYPDAWGRCGWTLLHACSFGVDPTLTRAQRDGMYSLLWALADVLPCQKCRDHLRERLSAHFYSASLPVFDTRASLTRALNELHNSVSRSIGKAEMSYEDMCLMYKEPVKGRCASASSSEKRGWWEVAREAAVVFVVSAVLALVVLTLGGRVMRCRVLGQCDCDEPAQMFA